MLKKLLVLISSINYRISDLTNTYMEDSDEEIINREENYNGTILAYKHQYEDNTSGIFINLGEDENDYKILEFSGDKYIGVDKVNEGIDLLLDKDFEESEDTTSIIYKKSYLFSEAFGSDIIGIRADQLNEKFNYEYHNCIEYKETVGNNLKKHIVIMVSKLEDSRYSGFIIRDGLVDYTNDIFDN